MQKPLVISYLRFSSPQQSSGDSIRRQEEARDRFLARMGLTLDESIRDEGVSGFRGKHRSDRHNLGSLLQLVKAGRIPRNSYLILESLDRLSREDLDDAVQVLLSLTNAGIRVVQLLPTEVIYQKPVDLTRMIVGVIELSRGHSESRMKSERVGAAWEAKRKRARETGAALTSQCPHWLRRVKDHYEVIPDRAATVQRIYELSAEGLGINSIIRVLLREERPPFGRSRYWNNSYLGVILKTRAVLGEFQPRKSRKVTDEPIPDFYPAVVSETLYYRVQEGLKARKRGGNSGRSKHEINLFSGLLFNAVDGDRIEYKWFTEHRGRSYARYTNALALVAQAPFVSFPVVPFEKAVRACLEEFDPRTVLDWKEDEDTEVVLRGQIRETEEHLQKIEQQLVEGGGALDTLVRVAGRLEERLRGLREQETAVKAKKATTLSPGVWDGLKKLSEEENGPHRREVRIRLQTAFRKLLDRADCLFLRRGGRQIAVVQLYFRGGSATRTVFVFYRGALYSRKPVVPEFLSQRTATEDEIPTGLNLRDPSHRQTVSAAVGKLLTEENWKKFVEPSLSGSRDWVLEKKRAREKARRQAKSRRRGGST